MGGPEIELFLTDLAVHGHVSASTHNQAFHALLFLYQHVLGIELPRLDAVRAKRPKRLPSVLCPEEVAKVLSAVQGGDGVFRLMAGLCYGSGLRREECCRLRVHDLDLRRDQITVRHGRKNTLNSPPGKSADDTIVGVKSGSVWVFRVCVCVCVCVAQCNQRPRTSQLASAASWQAGRPVRRRTPHHVSRQHPTGERVASTAGDGRFSRPAENPNFRGGDLRPKKSLKSLRR